MDKTLLISSIFLALLFYGTFLYGVIMYEKRRYARFVTNAIETEAIVEGIRLGWGIHSPTFCVHYYYYDNYGTKYEDNKAIGIQAFEYKKGDKFTVYYDPTNPRETRIKLKKKGR